MTAVAMIALYCSRFIRFMQSPYRFDVLVCTGPIPLNPAVNNNLVPGFSTHFSLVDGKASDFPDVTVLLMPTDAYMSNDGFIVIYILGYSRSFWHEMLCRSLR